MPDDFYIYLSSLGSSEFYRDNTSASFSNYINPSLTLEGEWSVGLVQCVFNDIEYGIKSGDMQYSCSVTLRENGKVTQCIFNLTEDIAEVDIEEAIANYELQLRKELKNKGVIVPGGRKLFKYNPIKGRVLFTPLNKLMTLSRLKDKAELTYDFNPLASRLLGCERKFLIKDHFIVGNMNLWGSFEPMIKSNLKYCNVFCDIVSHSFMGDTQANILDVMPLDRTNSLHNYHIKYKRVNKTQLSSASIMMCDENGHLVRFKDGGSTVCVLHFKRVY